MMYLRHLIQFVDYSKSFKIDCYYHGIFLKKLDNIVHSGQCCEGDLPHSLVLSQTW